jgi:probable rRNA maturation factor
VKITIKNLQNKIPINLKRIKKAAFKTLFSEGLKKSGEITVCFVNDKEIKELNLLYLGQNKPTDVIAFDNSQNKKEILADIAISTDTAARNAKIFKTTPLYEIHLYVVHGILHILGYADKTAPQRRIMQEKADNILNKLNINY